MIEEKLVAAELARRGITVSDAEVEESLRKDIAEQEAMRNPTPAPTTVPAADASPSPTLTPTAGPTPTSTAVPTLAADAFDTAYQSFLQRANLTDAAYRELKRAELARDRLRDDIGKNVQRTEEMVHARHILVDNDDSLQQVQQKLAEGVPFDQVAKDHSTDPGSRDKGGDLGWFPRGQMNAPFEAAAFSQPIGEVGQPVTSPNGTHIIQVLERDANHPLTAEQIDGKAATGYQAWYAGVRNGESVKNQMTPEGRAWVLRQVGPRPSGVSQRARRRLALHAPSVSTVSSIGRPSAWLASRQRGAVRRATSWISPGETGHHEPADGEHDCSHPGVPLPVAGAWRQRCPRASDDPPRARETTSRTGR